MVHQSKYIARNCKYLARNIHMKWLHFHKIVSLSLIQHPWASFQCHCHYITCTLLGANQLVSFLTVAYNLGGLAGRANRAPILE